MGEYCKTVFVNTPAHFKMNLPNFVYVSLLGEIHSRHFRAVQSPLCYLIRVAEWSGFPGLSTHAWRKGLCTRPAQGWCEKLWWGQAIGTGSGVYPDTVTPTPHSTIAQGMGLPIIWNSSHHCGNSCSAAPCTNLGEECTFWVIVASVVSHIKRLVIHSLNSQWVYAHAQMFAVWRP